MADQKLAVEIIFDAIDNTSRVATDLSSALGELDGKTRNLAAPFAEFASGLLKAETAMLALGAALVGVSIDKAGKFGDQIAEIGTLFGGTTDQMGRFSTEVLDYGQSSTQSLESINSALYSAISAGVKYGDALDLVAQAEKLAVAGRADLGQVTDVLTGALNAYGESTSEAARYSDVLFTTVKLGQTTVPELAAALGQVTSIASTAGVPFETLGAAIATLTAKGIGTSEAITGIKAALANIIKPSSQASDEAERLGIGFGVAELKSKGLDGVLRELIQATGGNVDQMAKFFGSVEGLNAVMALGEGGAARFSSAISDMAHSTGATEAAFGAMAENYSVALTKMANASDVALIKIGQPLLDQFGSVASAIANLFDGLGQGLDAGAFDPIIDLLERFGTDAANTLNQIAANLPAALEGLDFSDLVTSLEALGDTIGDLFSRLFDDVDLSTPEGLRDALQQVIDIITGLVDVTRGIATQFGPFFDVLGGLADNAGRLGTESSESFGKFLGAMQMVTDFGAGLGTLNAILVESGADIRGLADIVIGTATVIVNAFQVAFDTVMGAVVSFARDIVDVFEAVTPDFIGDPWKEISKELGYVLDGIGENWNRNNAEFVAGLDKIKTGFGGVSDSAGTAAAGVEGIKQPIVEAAAAAATFEPIDLGDVDFVAEAARRLGINLGEAKTAADGLQGATAGLPAEWATAEDKARGYKVIVDELGHTSYVQVGRAAKDAADTTAEAFDKQQERVDKATEAARNWALEMERLASNERIQSIEAVVSINVAEIQSQTEMVKAAFGSLNVTIESTGDLIGNLVGALKDNPLDNSKIWRLIADENDRRQVALDLQKQMVEEQIKYLQKRAEAIDRGDALIRVEADGLQPALEQIWYEIMKQIQVKAADEGMELLLGVMS